MLTQDTRTTGDDECDVDCALVRMARVWGVDGRVCSARGGLTPTRRIGGGGFCAAPGSGWRRVLRRTGQWVEADGAPAASKVARVKRPRSAVRFARVAVSDRPPSSASMLLRPVLTNGRRAEFEIGGVAQLSEVIGVLERAA
jgi:hypothetical protein